MNAPRLSPGHGLHPAAVAYWRGIWADGYGQYFSVTQRQMAHDLVQLVSDYERADDPKLRVRLSHSIRDLRADLGLLKPPPRAAGPPADMRPLIEDHGFVPGSLSIERNH